MPHFLDRTRLPNSCIQFLALAFLAWPACSKKPSSDAAPRPRASGVTAQGSRAESCRPAQDRICLRWPGRRRRLDVRARQSKEGGRGRLLPGKVKTSFVENVPEAADAERVIRDMVDQGNTLIFGTTFGYMEPMLKVASDNPNVHFEHATGYKTSANLRTYDSRTYEGAYLAGVVAGSMTKSKTLGVVGSIPIPEVIRNIDSFTLGAQSVSPDIKTKVVWVGKWFDPPKEGEAAQALLDRARTC